MDAPEIKICGLTTPGAVAAAVKHGAAYVGFVFYPPSPRNLSFQQAKALAREVPENVRTVAVMVDPGVNDLLPLFEWLRPDILQLHGGETPERIGHIRSAIEHPCKIMKAIPVRAADDLTRAGAYAGAADMLLFDARAPESAALPGGNGITFDWRLLAGREFPLPWFLSGGLNAENVRQATRLTGARRVDVSSGVESAPGVKDPDRIRQFITAAKHDGTA